MTTRNEAEAFREGVGKRRRQVEAHFKNRSRAAETAGVSKSTFQRWVNGEVDPSFTGLANIAQETGVSLDWLACGSGDIYGRASVTPKAGELKGPLTIDDDLLAQIAEGSSLPVELLQAWRKGDREGLRRILLGGLGSGEQGRALVRRLLSRRNEAMARRVAVELGVEDVGERVEDLGDLSVLHAVLEILGRVAPTP